MTFKKEGIFLFLGGEGRGGEDLIAAFKYLKAAYRKA